eukprot:Gb_16109 [translate_table: standard]
MFLYRTKNSNGDKVPSPLLLEEIIPLPSALARWAYALGWSEERCLWQIAWRLTVQIGSLAHNDCDRWAMFYVNVVCPSLFRYVVGTELACNMHVNREVIKDSPMLEYDQSLSRLGLRIGDSRLPMRHMVTWQMLWMILCLRPKGRSIGDKGELESDCSSLLEFHRLARFPPAPIQGYRTSCPAKELLSSSCEGTIWLRSATLFKFTGEHTAQITAQICGKILCTESMKMSGSNWSNQELEEACKETLPFSNLYELRNHRGKNSMDEDEKIPVNLTNKPQSSRKMPLAMQFHGILLKYPMVSPNLSTCFAAVPNRKCCSAFRARTLEILPNDCILACKNKGSNAERLLEMKEMLICDLTRVGQFLVSLNVADSKKDDPEVDSNIPVLDTYGNAVEKQQKIKMELTGLEIQDQEDTQILLEEQFHFLARELKVISGILEQCQPGFMLDNVGIFDNRGNIDAVMQI